MQFIQRMKSCFNNQSNVLSFKKDHFSKHRGKTSIFTVTLSLRAFIQTYS